MPSLRKKVKPLSPLAKARLKSFGNGRTYKFSTHFGNGEGFAVGLEEIAELIRHGLVSLRSITLEVNQPREGR